MAGNRAMQEIRFHNNASSVSDGETCMIVSDGNTLELDFIDKGIDETVSNFTAVIETKVTNESKWNERMAVDTATYDMSTKPSNFHTWELDVTGISYVRVRITSITGVISVLGRLVG